MDLAGMKRRELQALCKRHGLPAGGTNAALVSRLDAALLSGATGAEEEEVVAGVAARKGCLKQTGENAADAKKVTFAAEEGKARRLRSRVIWSPIIAKTRGKSAQTTSDSAAAAEEDSISAEAGKHVPVRRSRRNSVSVAEAEEIGGVVAVDRKRKRKNQENDGEGVAVSAQVGVSSRVTRRSSLAGVAVVLPPVVEKKRGRGKAAGGSNKLVDEAPDVQNSAQVEISARITGSRATAAPAVVAPIIVENKRRRKTIDARTNVELPTVSDVPKNDAPVTRSLRSRVVHVNNGMVDEQLETKMQPSRPLTRRHQQASSVEDKNHEQIVAPNKASLLRRPGRNHSEYVEEQPTVKEPVKQPTRKSVVLATLEKEENDPIEEKNHAAQVRRSTRKSIVPVKDIKCIGEGIQNANCDDAVKQPATKGPVRGLRRKSVFTKATNDQQFVVKQPTRRSSRKSVLPVMLQNNSELLAAEMNAQNSGKCQDDERQQKVKKPIRRSRRSVAAVPLEKRSNGLYEEKMSKNPMRRSTRKSVALNEVDEKVSMDHTEIVAREPEKVGEEGSKFRKHRRSSLEISSSANDSWRRQQNAQIPNETDSTGGTQQTSQSTTSKGRFSKRRRTTDPEEVMSVKEANDDIIIREATMDAHKETGEASGAAPPISDSDTNPEVRCNVKESVRAADLGKCPSLGSKGNPYLTSLHLEGADDDYIRSILNADKGCSSDRRHSSFGLELMFADACKESYSKNIENTAVEIVGGNKPSTPITRGFYVGSVCLGNEDVQPSGCDADNNLDVDQGVIGEENTAVEIDCGTKPSTPVAPGLSEHLGDGTEVLDQEKWNDLHVLAKTNMKMKLNDELGPGMESGCGIIEKNGRFVADNLGQQVIIQVQQGDMQECDLEKPSLCSATQESKHECGLPEEYSSVEIDGGNKPRALLTLGFSVGSNCLEYEDVQPTECDADKNLGVDQSVSGEGNIDVTPGFYVGSSCLEIEDVQPTRCDADKKLDVDQGVVEEVLAQEKSNDQDVPPKTDLNMKINDELASPGIESGCSITEKDARFVADNLDEQAIILVKQGDVEEATPLPEEVGGGSIPITPDFYVGSSFLEDEDVQPTGFDADKKLDGDKSVAEEEILAQQKSNDQHIATKTDLNMKLNDELASPCMESGCSITEKNTRLFADNVDQEAIFQDQQGDLQEGDLKKPSPCSATAERKHKYCLPEETILLPKNTRSLSSAEQSPFGLESLFSQENIDESMGSATARTKNGFDNSKDCHVKSALENTHVSEPYSLDDMVEGIPNGDDCMQTSQQDNGMEGKSPDGLSINFNVGDHEEPIPISGEGRVGLEANASKSQEKNLADIMPTGLYAAKSPQHDTDLIAEKTGKDNVDQQAIFQDQQDAIENPSVSLPTTGYKHEGAFSEEAAHTLKNYAGTSSSNPRELLMDLQSLFSKGNIKESNPHDGLAFPSAENSGDESISVEQHVRVHHGSDLSHIRSTDLLDELIGCSNAEDRCIVDRVEQIASEPCTNDIVQATAAAASECIESGLVLLPSDERSNMNDGKLNPKLASATSMGSGLNCDKYVCNTLANGSDVVVVGEKTPSASGLPEDYPKDHYPCQVLLDGRSVESSLQGTIFRKKIVSAVADIGSPSSSLATPDYKYEGALSKEAICRLKNYTGTSSVDPKHLIVELQSLHSEGSTEKPNLQDNFASPSAESRRDEPVVWHVEELLGTHVSSEPEPDRYQRSCGDLSRHEEKESCMKGSLTSVQIDLADDAHLIERDIVAPVELLCEENVERKCMPTSDSDILQEKSYSNGHGICQSRSQKHRVEANSRLSSCGTGTEVLHQDHKEECNEHNECKFSPKENNMSEDATIEGMESSIMLPLVAGTSEIPNEQLNNKMSDESEELNFSCDKDTIENFSTEPAKGDLYTLSKDFHIDTCQKQEVPKALSLPKSPEESAKFQCVSVLGSGPCQQHVNESTSMQFTYNIETVNQDHEEYNQNNEDQTTPGVSASSVSEAVEIEIEQSEMEIGLMPPTETSVLAVPNEQPNSKLESNEDQITLGIMASSVPEAVDQITIGIPASSVPEAVEIEQSEMEIGLIPAAAETSLVLPVPDEQPNSKLEGNEVEHNCSYDKDFFILFDSEPLKREASSLHKDDCMDLSSEDNHPNDLPASVSPESSVLAVPNEQPNSKLESNEDQITLCIPASSVPEAVDQITIGIPASSVPEAVEIEQSEMEIGFIPAAAETSVLPVPDELPNSKLEGNEVGEHSCSYDKGFFILSDSEPLKREASSLHKDDCMDLSNEDNHPNDLPGPRSPEPSANFQNDNDSGSVGICQSSRQRGIAELRAKLQSFKVSSTVKGSYIAMSAPRPKPGDSMSQSSIALLRNIENTTAVKTGHPVKPNADGKDSSRRALQPISGRPREH